MAQAPSNVGQAGDEIAADDRRACRRFPAKGPALLATKGRQYAAELIDVSAQGFGIRTEHHVVLNPGDLVRLKTAEGWLPMRVAYLWQQPKGTQLGLIRCEDTTARWRYPSSALPPLRRLLPHSASPWLLGGAIAIGTLWLAHSSERWGTWLTPHAAPATVRRTQPLTAKSVADVRAEATSGRPQGAEAFLSRPVVEYLALTASQRAQIERIVRDCELDVRRSGANRRAAAVFLAGAYRQAFRQLTPEQQRRWSEHLESSRK